MGSNPSLGTIPNLTVITTSINLALRMISAPPMPDGAKMVTLLPSLSFELDHSASRLCEFVHGIFQGFRCASSICTCDGLNGLAQ